MAATSEVTMSLDLFKSSICAARIDGLKEALEIVGKELEFWPGPGGNDWCRGNRSALTDLDAAIRSRIEELEKGNTNG